ncbi:LptA/OstA family protein [Salinarimonas chemoclinalis]|uniref:LptA/OstA family protein n=1 Tax=Salinarimonas chemoclinalis TaxID=3241599 RepID=UPI003556F025
MRRTSRLAASVSTKAVPAKAALTKAALTKAALTKAALTKACVALALLLAPAALAQQAPEPRTGAFGGLGSGSQEPIRIDADRLDVFERESRAVYQGNVVAVQGDTTMRCSELTIFFQRAEEGAPAPGGEAPDQAPGQGTESIDRIECEGPVTILSQDQVATGARAVYDRMAGQVVLTGDVALSQGQNVTRGERLVYDVDSGVANIESGGTQRVRGLFVPGGGQ